MFSSDDFSSDDISSVILSHQWMTENKGGRAVSIKFYTCLNYHSKTKAKQTGIHMKIS